MAPIEPQSESVLDRGHVSFAGLDSDRTVVWLTGEHDVSTVAVLSESLARAIALDDADLVVDLSGVEFMGAATVSVIVRAHAFLRLRSRSLMLRSPSSIAQRIVDLCGLHELLERPLVSHFNGRRAAGALGTWVAVPNRDPSGRAVGRTPSPATPLVVERVPAIRREGL